MKMSKTLLSIACAMVSLSAFADTTDIKASNNEVGIQMTATNVNYTETGNINSGLSTENGGVPGFALTASVMKDLLLGNDYIQAEYDRSSGGTNGVYYSPYGSYQQQDSALMQDYHVRYGKGFGITDQVMVTPYAEIGTQQWDRGGIFSGTYTNDYYGAGVLGQYSPINRLVLSGNAFLGHTYDANLNSSSYGSLGNDNLYRIGASADYALSQSIHANVGVDYTQFKYGASAVLFQPNSQSDYTTVKVGLSYAF